LEFDPATEAYMNGELSWEDYLFGSASDNFITKRSGEQNRGRSFSFIRVKDADENTTTIDINQTTGQQTARRLHLKGRGGAPVSAYLIFGKMAPEAPRTWANPFMEKLGASVCEHNPMTKFAHARAKLQMLTYVEAELDGCKKRATPQWIKMTRMNASVFQPPCKGALCCKVAEMVSEKMVCDGGTVAIPSCNASTCTWSYDCGNATGEPEVNQTRRPTSVYYRIAAALGSDGSTYSGSSPSGLSEPAKIGIGVAGGILGIAIIVVVVVVVFNKEKKIESV